MGLVENLDRHAGFARDRGRSPGEFARRQRVARFVRQLAREVAALAERPPARDRFRRGVRDPLVRVRNHDGPRGRGRLRLTGFVAAPVELRQRQPFRHRLRELGVVAAATDGERRTRDVTAARRQTACRRELTDQIAIALARSAADDHHAARAPASVPDRRHEELERLRLKLFRRERARQFAGRGGIETGDGRRRLVLVPRENQQISIDSG